MLQFLRTFIGNLLRAVIGLAMVAGALALGFIVATGVLLRLAWLRARPGRVPSPNVLRARAASGEVIDVEVREVRVR
jgi:hypothetical protein